MYDIHKRTTLGDKMDLQYWKKIKKEKKMTIADIAEKSGIPKGTVQNIFAGYVPTPRVDTVEAIEHALGLDEKKPLADEIIEQVAELNIVDYQNLSIDEKQKIAEIFNATVSAFKKK